MKRGLKDDILQRILVSLHQVEEDSPMKRGLKVHASVPRSHAISMASADNGQILCPGVCPSWRWLHEKRLAQVQTAVF